MTDNNQPNRMELIAKVQASGSLIAKNRDTVTFQADVDDDSSGFIFAPQKKEIYNTDELKKSLDVEVTELIGEGEETDLDLVARSLYEEALEALADALDTIEIQSTTIGELEARITQLETENETLKEEVDNEKLLRVLAEENAEALREEISLLTNELQSAIQRSVLDGIENSSLLAKNEGLFAQVEALKDEVSSLRSDIDELTSSLEGKEAAIEQGAKAGIDISVRVTKKIYDGDDARDIIYRKRVASTSGTWYNGPSVEIYNFSTQPVTVSITHGPFSWISARTYTVNANQKVVATLQILSDKVNQKSPASDTEYRDLLTFTTANGSVSLTTGLQIQRGGKWARGGNFNIG
jgi:outer membrane murein-binding lipoprotein Lpp